MLAFDEHMQDQYFCVDRPNVVFKVKGKSFPYLLPSIGPGADPGVQAVSVQVTISHPPRGRLPLLSARPAVIFPAAEHTASWLVPSYIAW